MTEYIPDFEKLRQIADTDLAIKYSIFWTAVIMSACWSNSIAEKKLRGRILHTILGGIGIIVYPLLIMFMLPSKSRQMPKTTINMEEEKDDLPLDDLNEAYFKSIYIDKEGNHTGPYVIDMEGEIIQANLVSEVQADYIVVEVENNHGKLQRIRVPYSKITSCTQVDDPVMSGQVPELAWLTTEDKKMAIAIRKAQREFSKFTEEMDKEKRRMVPALDYSGLKIFVPVDSSRNNGEHIFVNYVGMEGNQIVGTVACDPQFVQYVEGETIKVPKTDLSDWFYVVDGKGVGGYTFPVIAATLDKKQLALAKTNPPMMWFI